jgi:N-methylhydantoinase B
MMCQAGFGSLDLARSSYTCFYEALAGGYGGRHGSDGPDAVQAHGQNTENAPIEETELNYPVQIARLSLVENSEGPGRFRGGLGLRKDFRMLQPTTFTILADRDRRGPWGAVGGHDAAVAEYVLIRDGVETRLGSKSTTDVLPGDVVSVRSCGGGGYGPPEQREPGRVLRDVLEGKVSVQRAREEYRVAIADRRLDEDATSELRRQPA